MQETLKERTVGELIGQAFSLTFKNLGKLFMIQLIFGIIIVLIIIPFLLLFIIAGYLL